ncbi:MAG: hypothetical protein P9M14_04345, partial [Candidatus Alcyoniella australis]|nr:hypothetical protein [Candidatus Alcyoniella australis]
MRGMPIFIASLILVAAITQPWFTPQAAANDMALGGSAAGVYPLNDTQIRLERERVTFYELDRGGWQVLALLTFYNPTDQPIQMQVGFPVTLLGEGYDEFVVR